MIACLLLFADSGNGCFVLRDEVERIEVNHVLNDSGEVMLDQVIFWDYSPSQSRYVVRAWRTLKSPSQKPMKLAGGGYQAIWHDPRDISHPLRKVRAKSVSETWTDYDPETNNGEFLDRSCRRELSQPSPRKSRRVKK